MTIHRGLKLRHLRIFLAIAEAGSISGAARDLGITQPSVSKALGDLEAMVSARLLERAGRGVALTPKGDTFRRHAAQALKSLDAGAEAVRGDAPGRVSVGVLPTVAGGFFPDVALPFVAQHPGLRLTITTGSHLHLLGELRAGRIDMMLGRMPDTPEMPGLRFHWLYDEEIVLVARAGHPLRDRPAEEALRSVPVILPPDTAIIRRTVEDYLTAIHVTQPDVSVQTVSLAPALRFLEGSDMLWFISRGVVERELRRGTLVAWPLDVPFLSGAVGITTRANDRDHPGLRLLHDALSAAAPPRAEGARQAVSDREAR
ncbi:LysR substrate-binding domain-containing protein [Palleronia sp.]|uniref:LysR substrate-binding domain-containing protein n=1 Tax=Palleronia sp. TaxID=1940284 RepID=UPI0035C82882